MSNNSYSSYMGTHQVSRSRGKGYREGRIESSGTTRVIDTDRVSLGFGHKSAICTVLGRLIMSQKSEPARSALAYKRGANGKPLVLAVRPA